jgi:hypothetical protein
MHAYGHQILVRMLSLTLTLSDNDVGNDFKCKGVLKLESKLYVREVIGATAHN